MDSLLSAWNWVKEQAIATILALPFIAIALVVYIHFYPITIRIERSRTENFVRYDSSKCYVLSSTWDSDGAEVLMKVNTVSSTVKNEVSE